MKTLRHTHRFCSEIAKEGALFIQQLHYASYVEIDAPFQKDIHWFMDQYIFNETATSNAWIIFLLLTFRSNTFTYLYVICWSKIN